jgi:OOP family OmpA-OmpF porin
MLRWLSALTLAALLGGCASAPSPGVCAAIGGVLGGGGGIAVGASTPDHNSDEQALYGGAGAILGASTGYLICRAMQAEPAPPPPPPPKAAPAAPPAPAVDRCAELIRLRGVNFDFDRAEIRSDAAVILDEAATLVGDALRECPNNRLAVEGHTDAIGTDAYNQGLSERRAAAVLEYLVGKGVSSSQLGATGFGESAPIATNDTSDGRALNRRVELRLVQ